MPYSLKHLIFSLIEIFILPDIPSDFANSCQRAISLSLSPLSISIAISSARNFIWSFPFSLLWLTFSKLFDISLSWVIPGLLFSNLCAKKWRWILADCPRFPLQLSVRKVRKKLTLNPVTVYVFGIPSYALSCSIFSPIPQTPFLR